MAIAVEFDLTGIKPLLRTLQQMPNVVRRRVLLPAAERAGEVLELSIASFIPVNRKPKKKNAGHYRYNLTSVIRDYEATKSVVVLVGAESGTAPHAHFLEDGTQQRFTNHKTKYKLQVVGVRYSISRGEAIVRTSKEKRSQGSFLKTKNQQASGKIVNGKTKWKTPKAMNRGVMPATHPVQRGVNNAQSKLTAQLKNDITRGLQEEIQRMQNR